MANNAFASASDISTFFRTLSQAETKRANALLPVISNELRVRADAVGMDLDQMAEEDEAYADVLKEVTAGIVFRILRQNTEGEAMTQYSQSALGYSVSGTYAIPGGGIGNAIMNADLKRLGIKRQKFGTIDPYAPEGW
jgi:hypothetical protein